MTTARLEQLLRDRMGLAIDTIGRKSFHHALDARQAALQLPSREAYVQVAAADRREWDELLEMLVVPETWFFRGRATFEHLGQVARRGETNAASSAELRILSVPCSTGEEPYSIVMALAEDGWPLERLTVHAIDLSSHALAGAAAATYSPRSFREVTPLALICHDRYFTRDGALYRLDRRIRDAVKFWQGNLANRDVTTDGLPYDLVFCRNLLIYLHDEARRVAVDNLCRWTKPGGYVFAGHAEPLNRIDGRLEPAPPTDAFVFRRLDRSPFDRSPFDRSNAKRPAAPPSAAPPSAAPPSAGSPSAGSRRSPHAPPQRPTPHLPRVHAPVTPPKSGAVSAKEDFLADVLAQAKEAANRGDVAEAARLCRQHLAAAPSSAAGHCLLGVVLQAQGQAAEARVQFERAVYLDPEHAEALTHLMFDARRKGDGAAELNLRRRLERIGRRANVRESGKDGTR